MTREITISMLLVKVDSESNSRLERLEAEKGQDNRSVESAYKMRFTTVAFLYFGLSLVAILKDRK